MPFLQRLVFLCTFSYEICGFVSFRPCVVKRPVFWFRFHTANSYLNESNIYKVPPHIFVSIPSFFGSVFLFICINSTSWKNLALNSNQSFFFPSVLDVYIIMMDTAYLQRMLIIRSGFTSLPLVSFMSCSSHPVPGLRLSAAIPLFPHTPS
jgi:hypothetical protein